MSFDIREIGEQDLEAVIALLCEGFPAKERAYWAASMVALGQRAEVSPYPRYGYVLFADGAAQGVILLLTARIGQVIRSNLSSWYVRPAYRKLASFLFQRSLKIKGGIYLNVSPAPHVLPIVQAFGFKPYTAGTQLLDPRAAFRRGGGRVRAFNAAAVDGESAEIIARHRNYGCSAVLIEDGEGVMPALYRVRKVRGLVPVAYFLWGSPERIAGARGAIMRWLIKRGTPIALIDAPLGQPQRGTRLFPDKGTRYAKGVGTVTAGDLLDTELAVFGM